MELNFSFLPRHANIYYNVINNYHKYYLKLRSTIRKMRISIQASHEQFHPSDLLEDVLYMEKKGIKRCWTSDHYMPWWNSGASGGAAWPWMGAALAKTHDLVLGTGVTAPILRYHPAIVAQVFATLASMFPNRVILGLGRGEAMNEVTSGNVWPNNSERFAMLREAIKLIKNFGKRSGLPLVENITG